MRLVRCLVYRLGFRPRYPSMLYSPSLDWRYADVGGAFAHGIESTRRAHDERESDQ